jgi:hypothetical protein
MPFAQLPHQPLRRTTGAHKFRILTHPKTPQKQNKKLLTIIALAGGDRKMDQFGLKTGGTSSNLRVNPTI